MTSKSRVERLEGIIKPGKGEAVTVWHTDKYKDEAELDQAIEKWELDHPEEKPCNEQVRHIIMNMGFKTDQSDK